jgi:glycosyltransferase involved in cell wall biosynthesis
MGRQIAGMGFVDAMARHGESRELYCYARTKAEFADFESQVAQLTGEPRPCVWIPYADLAGLAKPGTLYYPSPHYTWLSWQRRFFGSRAYSLCGVTHTLCTESVLDTLGDYLTAPLESWDALICTSRAGKAATQRVFAGWGEYLAQRFGGGMPRVPVQMPVIPLGVDSGKFAPRKDDAKMRAALRRKLGIAKDDVAFLFVGRLSHFEKAHPMPMYLGLEAAAKRTGKRLHLIQAGRTPNDATKKNLVDGARLYCPSVNTVFVPGDDPAVDRDLWLSCDVFVSLSDNIQETFGLTPVEAMAAGLPAVVSDWDGYRDTVRHGVDGFAVPTLGPPPGMGEEFAFRWYMGTDSYDHFVGHSSQCTAVDVAAAADAFAALAADAGLRRRMGDSGRARAAADYDWRNVIAAYHELWRELAERRAKDAEATPRQPGKPAYPLRPDPFTVFAGFPTALLSPESVVTRSRNPGAGDLAHVCEAPMNTYALGFMAPAAKTEEFLAQLGASGPVTVAAILGKAAPRDRAVICRTLCWLAKMGLISIRTP